jgi:hypothetical protein
MEDRKMLDENQIYQNKLSFVNLLSCLEIDLTELYTYLDVTDYFNKPASTQYFRAYPGGLCQYALDLYYELAQLVNAYCPGKYTKADVVKVALFKDLYRTELYECYMKNVKNDETGQWESVPAYRTRDGASRPVYGDARFSAYMQIKNIIPLTDEQIEAIVQSGPSEYTPDIHEIYRAYPLVTLTRMAEFAATYIS